MQEDRKQIRAWLMYDWANSAFATTMMAAVLPIFYSDVAAATLNDATRATSYWGFTQTIAMLLVAVMTPILGAIADETGSKTRFLRVFTYVGVLASAGFVLVGKGDYILASILFIFGSIGFSGGNAFYDAMLPDLVESKRRDYVSSQGFMYGYIGGGLLLVLNLLMIQMPGLFGIPNTATGTYISFATVAVWWFVFSVPIFRHVKNTGTLEKRSIGYYTQMGFSRVVKTFKHILHYPELVKYLIAFLLFNDGISTIITMATVYGKEIGIKTEDLIAALVITQFVGIPFTLLFGKIADRLGSKASLYISLSIYVLIVALGYFMTSAVHFYALAFMVGLVQGGSQSIARSIFSRLIPAGRAAEFFGFLTVSSKFSSIMGPFVFSIVGIWTGSSRFGILSLILFFLAGIYMLTRVNLEKGQQQALEKI
ncbi:MFS transporter [Paenibacillus sp. HJGM_3]|uniref:MFS transporter n=1 Tax=Paenibacillus sp. HJGM_3 TaxID=3379816 RepID=UPI0038671F68